MEWVEPELLRVQLDAYRSEGFSWGYNQEPRLFIGRYNPGVENVQAILEHRVEGAKEPV